MTLGFATSLVIDGCRGVGLQPGAVEKSIEEMVAAGVRVTSSDA